MRSAGSMGSARLGRALASGIRAGGEMGGATGPFTVGMEYRDRHRRLKVIRVGGPSIWVEHLDGDPPGRVENEPLKFRRPSEGISSRATEQRSEPSARE